MLLRSGTYYGTTYKVGELDFKFTIKTSLDILADILDNMAHRESSL